MTCTVDSEDGSLLSYVESSVECLLSNLLKVFKIAITSFEDWLCETDEVLCGSVFLCFHRSFVNYAFG